MTFSASPLIPGAGEVDEQVWQGIAGQVCTAIFDVLPELPSPEPVTLGDPTRDTSDAVLPPNAAAGVTAFLTGALDGKILVVVGQDLVAAMEGTPFGELPLAQALKPLVEGAARQLGARVDGEVEEVPAASCLEQLTGGTPVVLPVLAGDATTALIAFSIVAMGGDAATEDPVSQIPTQGGSMPTGSMGAGPNTGAVNPNLTAGDAARSWGIDMLRDVEMEVTCELGRTRMTVRRLLSLAPGDVVELDRLAGAPADLLVNGTLLARGEVVVVDESFGLRITQIVTKDDA